MSTSSLLSASSRSVRLPAAPGAAALVLAAALGAAAALPAALSAQDGNGGAPELTDPEIAHIAVTANAIDVELAELALERSSNDAVREFAGAMVNDHTGVNERAAALVGRLGVTPEDNGVSASLQGGAAEARSRLESLRGDSFDRAYMDREVAYHAAVLGALDDVLIPQASNAELRSLLAGVRPAIAAHLAWARELRAELGGGR